MSDHSEHHGPSEHHGHKDAEHKGTSSSISEVIGIFAILIGLLLGISLFTYNPLDPSFSTATTQTTVENAIGRVGATAADLCFQIVGVSAYFIPILLIGFGIRRLNKGSHSASFRSRLGWSLLMFILLTFAELIADSTTPLNLRGGALGVLIHDLSRDYLGSIGTYITLAFFSLFGWMLVAPSFSPSNIVQSLLAPLEKGWNRITLLLTAQKEKKEKLNHDEVKKNRHTEIDPDDHPEIHETLEASDNADETYISDSWAMEDLPPDRKPGYQLPPLSLLADPPAQATRVSHDELAAQSKILKRKLADFGVTGEVRDIHPGPVVTLFEFEPAPGIKLSRITVLADDLALAMRAAQVRIVPRIPGKPVVGIEIPNRVREGVFLKEILASPTFAHIDSKLRIALGKDISGAAIAGDLADMPHLLIAGSTGSGKSVGLNSIILSILFTATPSEVKLLLIDPKMLELSLYQDIPHLFAPVITRPNAASSALRKMVEEMQRRYELLSEKGVRNIEAYNKLCAESAEDLPPPAPTQKGTQAPELPSLSPPLPPPPPPTPLPYIIVFIDELADLMVVAPRDVEESVGRLAQMARAAGIHLVLATQRPSVDVITGVIKANFTARIAYAVTSKIDSRTILDANGAEQLLGKGDMLCLSAGTSRLLRIHGAYVSEDEVKRVVAFIKKQGDPLYEQSFTEESPTPKEASLDLRDELYNQACELVLSTGQASASFIQRRLRVGYPRAARMIELMEEDGLVGPAVGSKPREIRKEPVQ